MEKFIIRTFQTKLVEFHRATNQRKQLKGFLTESSVFCTEVFLWLWELALASIPPSSVRLPVETLLFPVAAMVSLLPCLLFLITKLLPLLSVLWLLLIPAIFSLLLARLLGVPGLPSFKMSPSLKMSTTGPCLASSLLSSGFVSVSSLVTGFFLQQHFVILLQSLNNSKKGRIRKKTKLKKNSLVLFRGLVTSFL